jgi:SAM-dependent methyltransferase
MGRWNRPIARQFVGWLNTPPGQSWLDVGCGSGVLTGVILNTASPRAVVGVDRSEGYLAYARQHVDDSRVRFKAGDAQELNEAPHTFDITVSALVLNFVPSAGAMASSMARVTKAGGIVACYVWDYLGGMQPIRYFWEAATRLDPGVRELPEVLRYPLCRPKPLTDLFCAVGLRDVELRGLEDSAVFTNFDDYWHPFLDGQGTAPTYLVSLPTERREELRERVRDILPIGPNGQITLSVGAWAVRGRVPDTAARE